MKRINRKKKSDLFWKITSLVLILLIFIVLTINYVIIKKAKQYDSFVERECFSTDQLFKPRMFYDAEKGLRIIDYFGNEIKCLKMDK